MNAKPASERPIPPAPVQEIKLPQGGIACALIGLDHSKIIIVPPAELLKFVPHQLFPEECKTMTQVHRGGPVTIRLIGSQEKTDPIASLLTNQGYRLGKSVYLKEPFPVFHFIAQEGRIRIPVQLEHAQKPLQARIKVLVVDDSETIRKILTKVIATDSRLECVGAIANPLDVEAAIQKLRPDVLTLDIHMPEMNGVELLKKILVRHPIPAIMISALSREDGNYVLDAMESGAIDYIQKPSLSQIGQIGPMICEKIFNASKAQVRKKIQTSSLLSAKSSKLDPRFLIVIGSSTGGTEALREVLTSLPDQIPPVLIVQHIPPVFSKAFADRMNQLVAFEVREACDGERIVPNQVLIAPGGKQMSVKNLNGTLKIKIDDSPPINRHKPSVDYLFDSVAELKLKKLIGVILTGMGADGAKGLLNLKKLGARTIGQDEATCVVYGMPREAAMIGALEKVAPLQDISGTIAQFCKINES
jgi:two-component system chemotaxis response regulator CheB